MVFDESHWAKTKTSNPFKVFKWLQHIFSKAKVMYVTATIGTEPNHMSYMDRLGLWGKDCPFLSLDEFLEQMSDRLVKKRNYNKVINHCMELIH